MKNPSRRQVLQTAALQTAILSCANAEETSQLKSAAGVDRITVQPGKTYLHGWAGYGDAPRPGAPRNPNAPPPAPAPAGPPVTVAWSKESGPGEVKFADPKAGVTAATFTKPGAYVLKL